MSEHEERALQLLADKENALAAAASALRGHFARWHFVSTDKGHSPLALRKHLYETLKASILSLRAEIHAFDQTLDEERPSYGGKH